MVCRQIVRSTSKYEITFRRWTLHGNRIPNNIFHKIEVKHEKFNTIRDHGVDGFMLSIICTRNFLNAQDYEEHNYSGEEW